MIRVGMRTIRISCSPDADDLFMVRALLEGQLDTGDYRFEIGTSPTDALNALAHGEDAPEVLAISIAHYPKIADRYRLLPHGGSMGEGYGPVVVGRRAATVADLHGARIGIPGLTTTAWLVLQLLLGPNAGVEPVVIPIEPYARTFEAVRSGEVDYALVIHEGRLTFAEEGTELVVDIGAWWQEETATPLPLGGNVIQRGLGEPAMTEISALLKQSIAHALEHRDLAIDWLLARGGALRTRAAVSEYLGMYANQRTLDYGPEGRRGVEVLFERAAAAGLLDAPATIDWAP